MITVPTMEVTAPLACTGGNFAEHYVFGAYLGRGAYGEVRRCTSRVNGVEYAVKELDRSRMNKEAEEVTQLEIEISRDLDHRNVVCMRHCFLSPSSYRIVMELIHGGELFDAIVERDRYSEKDALICIQQVLSALQYCHNRSIIHRDLKPENLLLSRKMDKDESMEGIVIKLVDFGLALKLPDGEQRMKADTRGTPYCIAPETLRELPLGCPVDMWACGAVFYFMLVGMPPFWPGEGSYGQQQMYLRIVDGKYTFDNPEWASVSTRTRSLVTKMLTVDQDERLSAEASLHHVGGLINETKLRSLHRQATLHRMKAFRGKQRLSTNMVLQLVAARRRIMETEDEDEKSPRSTPELFKKLSSVDSGGHSSPDSKSPVCNKQCDPLLCAADEPRRRRKRSKSMREIRDQDIDKFIEQAELCMPAVQTCGDVNTEGESTNLNTSSADRQPVALVLRVSAVVPRQQTVEQIGAETVVEERRKRRISMLAELEPGNNRLWSDVAKSPPPRHPDAGGASSLSPSSDMTNGAPPSSPHHHRTGRLTPSIPVLEEQSEGSSAANSDTDSKASSACSSPGVVGRDNGGVSAIPSTGACPDSDPQMSMSPFPAQVTSPRNCRESPCLADGVVSSASGGKAAATRASTGSSPRPFVYV